MGEENEAKDSVEEPDSFKPEDIESAVFDEDTCQTGESIDMDLESALLEADEKMEDPLEEAANEEEEEEEEMDVDSSEEDSDLEALNDDRPPSDEEEISLSSEDDEEYEDGEGQEIDMPQTGLSLECPSDGEAVN